jgi:hypothetical protein
MRCVESVNATATQFFAQNSLARPEGIFKSEMVSRETTLFFMEVFESVKKGPSKMSSTLRSEEFVLLGAREKSFEFSG